MIFTQNPTASGKRGPQLVATYAIQARKLHRGIMEFAMPEEPVDTPQVEGVQAPFGANHRTLLASD